MEGSRPMFVEEHSELLKQLTTDSLSHIEEEWQNGIERNNFRHNDKC